MTTTITAAEASTRFTHKATGITWNCATQGSAAAPFVLRLHNPRRRGPATSHRFTTAGNRDKYVARCIANAQEIDRDIAANFYPTPPEATRALLSVETFDGPIWEPACGKGHIAKVLKAQGHEVIATDLNEWGYGVDGIDFLATNINGDNLNACHIITNPPYGRGLADAFIEKALAVAAKTGGKVAMLLNLASLAHEQRTAFWRKNPPARLYAIDGVVCWPNSERAPPKHFLAQRYVWAVWEHGHSGPSTFGWLSCAEFRETSSPPTSQAAPRRFANATAPFDEWRTPMSNTTLDAITANITLLEARLKRAHIMACEALAALHDGKQNLAFGTLLPMYTDLADADALLRTACLLHRARP